MEEIIKIAALGFCSVILIVLVKSYKPEFGIYTAAGCSILFLYMLLDSMKYAFAYLSDLYGSLEVGKAYFPIIIKVLVIAYLTEFIAQLCKDAGESSIASKIELGGKLIIFCISIPVFTSILNLVKEIL